MKSNPYAKDSDQWRAWRNGYEAGFYDWRDTFGKPRWRSSVTGRFIAKLFGKANPRESVEEK